MKHIQNIQGFPLSIGLWNSISILSCSDVPNGLHIDEELFSLREEIICHLGTMLSQLHPKSWVSSKLSRFYVITQKYQNVFISFSIFFLQFGRPKSLAAQGLISLNKLYMVIDAFMDYLRNFKYRYFIIQPLVEESHEEV